MEKIKTYTPEDLYRMGLIPPTIKKASGRVAGWGWDGIIRILARGNTSEAAELCRQRDEKQKPVNSQ